MDKTVKPTKCTVSKHVLTIKEAEHILNTQQDNINSYLNDKDDALKTALVGSKRYLEHKKLI